MEYQGEVLAFHYYCFPYLNTNPRMTFSILTLYCWRFHQSSLKSWPRKFTNSSLEVIMHCHKSFQTSAVWKEHDSAMAESKRALGSGMSQGCSEEPFLCRRLPWEAPAPVLTRSRWLLLFVRAVKGFPERGLGQALSGNKKSRSVAVGLTNVMMFAVPVGTLISLSHHRKPRVKRKSFAFRYCGRARSFETQVTLRA